MSFVDRDDPVALLGHFDADGLSAMAILHRMLARAGWGVWPRIVGRGERVWSDPLRTEVMGRAPGGVIVLDLGVEAGVVFPGIPTIIIDHHVPRGSPEGALILSGYGLEPQPTTSLLTWWAATALGPAEDLLWLAAIGLIGDMADRAGFPEMDRANARWGKTALRDAAALLNAPRRSASGDATPALRLLMRCDGPRDILSGDHPETARLLAARDEVRAATEAARRVPPVIRGDIALIELDTPCQIHPLVAQSWKGRLRDRIVIVANRGYRDGWVHFAARTARPVDLTRFLAAHRPSGAGDEYGGGHAAASGGALRPEAWTEFLERIGFGEAVAP
ncbi:DHH family phosphoesterase [Rubellimicrobium sp. CFH 75288]|uniref:DHH family phosphoesterase n=1 Tax=Rubellimicrobium sp. CFH 75288 TaxID=2697034 RepID=UPI001412B213|nr:DHH family phosphoesterase [Rubellimicrobium sp. CFH 75288]NAZ37036.1 phosphoesterase [Rubellimicrobium sp. CFH 75288]